MKLFNNNIVPYISTEGDNIYPIVVDIKKGLKSGEAISFVTADNQVGVITVDFMDGNSSYSIEGCIVTSTIHRPDGTVLEIPCGIISQCTIEIPLGINGTYQEGVHTFDIKIIRGNGKVIGVPTMSYSVLESLSSDGVVEDDDRLPVLTMVLDNVQDRLSRLDKAIAGATNDLEVKEARDGEVTLNARLERDLEKGKIHFVDVEGSSISTESQEGYLENVEIHGNTWQDSENLEDIRSVGTKVEGQELYEIDVVSVGKNLFNPSLLEDDYLTNYRIGSNGALYQTNGYKALNGYKEIPKQWLNRDLIFSFIGCIAFYSNKSDSGLISRFFQNTTISVPQNAKYFRIDFQIETPNFQLEEGTQATPYEPYQEDKLTILSPVQLEKVGDVADRIICKDGVWGIEKNICTEVIKISSLSLAPEQVLENTNYYKSKDFDSKIHPTNSEALCDKLEFNNVWSVDNVEGINILGSNQTYRVRVRLLKDTSLKEFTLKYILAQPQFIPLPNSQQIKLRTFADKTHIHFDTEIQPTLKAQVPKSLGATVNTHTSQIDNLNKELDRVKKLEESTVTTVTSNSSFTSVAETTQGYFEDVKIEGKTLVNLCSNFRIVNMHSYQSYIELEVSPNTKYTVIVPIYANHVYGIFSSDGKKTILDYRLASVCNIFNFTSDDNTNFRLYCRLYDKQGSLALEGELNKNACDVILLEGDHTDKDISFFEGLKSVGQDTDEIVVSSVNGNGNLVEYIELNGVSSGAGEDYTNIIYVRTNYITVEPNQTYNIKHSTNVLYKDYVVYFYDSNKSYLGYKFGLTSEFTTVANTKFIRIDMKKADGTANTQEDINNCDFVVSKCKVSEYIPYQSDKKRLLYYNPNTQTWEKPILREWDSIEKHSDGKYYYHKRSGEVVLNGSESWAESEYGTKIPSMYTPFHTMRRAKSYSNILISNRFRTLINNAVDEEGISGYIEDGYYVGQNWIYINTNKTVAELKQWLQSNPVTVAYQLAKEEVYECTNLDLITYSGETNLIVNSGAIQPKITLKVLSNVSNVVKLLQEKVSVLENKFINGLKQVLAGDMMSLAHLLYPEDFENNHEIQT